MEIEVKRIAKKSTYTIGKLYIDGKYICDTLEDTDRGICQTMDLRQIAHIKIKGKTAIPAGRYEVVVTYSPKFRMNLPILKNVPGYEGVRIHAGNTASDTEGCILCGKNDKIGQVTNSREWTYNIVNRMIARTVAGHNKVYITIG